MAAAVFATDAPPPRLRALLAVAFGAVALLAALAASVLAGAEGARRLEAEIARDLRGLAGHLAETLDRGLFERWRDIQIAAALPSMRDPATPAEARRVILARLAETYPGYALVAFIGPDLRVAAATQGALEGADASGHHVVQAARDGPVASDAQDDAPPQAGPPGLPAWREPTRRIGLAAPVHGPDGGLTGIVAAQLHWDWARGIAHSLQGLSDGERRGIEIVVLSRDGEVLVGPQALAGRRVARAAGGDAIAWPDGGDGGGGAAAWLTGTAATRGHRDYPGLGWTVAVRQDADQALAPVAVLQRRVVLWGGAAALAAALLGWAFAGWIARPLRALTEAAERLRHDRPAASAAGAAAAPVPDLAAARLEDGAPGVRRRYREADTLREALEALVAKWRRTDRERAEAAAALAEQEAALRASEERLRLAQQAGGIGAWELNIPSRTRHWSEGTYRLWGLDPGEALTLDRIMAVIHPDDRAMVRAHVAQAATRLGPFPEIEFRILRPSDGALRWLRSSGETLPGPDGRPFRQLGVMRDVTARKLAEAALRDREAQLARVQRIGRVGGFEIDLTEGGFRNRRSPEYLRLHGLPQEAEHESHEAWVSRLHPEDRARVDAAFRAAVAGGARDYAAEYRIVTPDGEVRWISAVAEIERDAAGRPLRMVGAHRDVTPIKAAEAALREANDALERRVAERTAELAASEAALARIYHRTPAALHSVGPDGRLINVSDQWLAFLGYERAEVLGRRPSEFMTPESGARWEAVFVELQAPPPGPAREVEYRMLRKGGEALDVLLRARAEHDAEGRFLRSYSVLVDVTERNRAEARLREAQKLEALGRVAGGVAHDFNNLLQVITSALRLIEGHAGDPGRVRRYAGAAQDAADRGASLVRRMLAFAGREELHVDLVDCAALLEGLRDLLEGSLGPGIRVALDLAPDLLPARADAAQLDMVLFNLAINARDAMPEGGTLTLSATAEAIGPQHASGLALGRYLRIAVRDTGTGMDAATLAHATEPFFTTKETGQGTGLGLSMAHGFAEQSGGRLAIVSAPGHGTTVALLLPAATDDATAEGAGPVPEPVGREPPAEGSGLSLLLVDDAAAEARATLGGELHAAGFEVARADHAGAALARLGGPERFDAVVIDLAAPGGGDAALASELSRRHPGLPILRITANDAAPAAPEGGTAPSAALPGPAAPQAVVRAVLGLVRGRRGAPPPASAAAAIA